MKKTRKYGGFQNGQNIQRKNSKKSGMHNVSINNVMWLCANAI